MRFLSALVFVVLSACGQDIYGKAVPYSPLAPDPIEVSMPEGALFLSQQFSPRQLDVHYVHYGIDVWGRPGTPIVAAAPGTVFAAFTDPMHGRQVQVLHGTDTDGAIVITTYHHLLSRDVKTGQRVARGQRLGTMGSSGMSALMNHLHFELRRGPTRVKAKPVDPHLYWVGGTGNVTCFEPGRDYDASPVRLTYPTLCR